MSARGRVETDVAGVGCRGGAVQAHGTVHLHALLWAKRIGAYRSADVEEALIRTGHTDQAGRFHRVDAEGEILRIVGADVIGGRVGTRVAAQLPCGC